MNGAIYDLGNGRRVMLFGHVLPHPISSIEIQPQDADGAQTLTVEGVDGDWRLDKKESRAEGMAVFIFNRQ